MSWIRSPRALGLPLLSAIVLLALSGSASADKAVSQGGEAAGQTRSPQGLAVDFGWGVADGQAQLESCGPAASPPTAGCQKGLAGAGAGEFDTVSNNNGLSEIAVDNDPASVSHYDVYVLERDETDYENAFGHSLEGRGYRVQKFDPEGHFLLTFGGRVISGGASGTGNLASGSVEVTNVQTAAKAFEVSQEVESPGRCDSAPTSGPCRFRPCGRPPDLVAEAAAPPAGPRCRRTPRRN